jgi:hypothetical protein
VLSISFWLTLDNRAQAAGKSEASALRAAISGLSTADRLFSGQAIFHPEKICFLSQNYFSDIE